MVKSFPIIENDLSWQVGRGIQIQLGINPICGLKGQATLSHELVAELHRNNSFVLKDVQKGPWGKYSADSKGLSLCGNLADEWEWFICSLNQGNIIYSDSAHKLVWDYNQRDGNVTAKLAYRSIISLHEPDFSEWWTRWLWNGKFPIKIKLFMWLVFMDKILTWESL